MCSSDLRFIVTNLPGRAKVLYEKIYCARGRMENMIKDHKLYTRSDRSTYTLTLPSLGSQPVPPLPAQRRLLAAAPIAPGSTPAFTLAHGDRLRELLTEIVVDEVAHAGQRRNFIGSLGMKASYKMLRPLYRAFFNDIPETKYLFDVDKMKVANVRNIGTKQIKVKAGRFEALGIQHQAVGSSRVTTLWCVEELGYLPVMIEQHRKGKLKFRASLLKYTPTGG